MARKTWILITLIILAHLFLLMNLKFTAWPEMLLWPYMMIQGLLPYKDIAIAHTPHLIVDLAIFFKIFGVGVFQLKIYTWILIIFTDLIVYWVSNKLWNRKIAIVSILSFIILQIFFDGNGLWFDSLLVPFSVLLFYLVSKKNYFWSGIVWTVMFLTKQTAVWFLIPIVLGMVKGKWSMVKENFINLIYGSVAVFIFFILLLFTFNLLPSFYTWAINFGIFVLPGAQGQIQFPDLKNIIVAGFPFVVFIPLFVKHKTLAISTLLWTVAGVMGTYPRFEYFHFQPALPFLAFAIGVVFMTLKRDGLVKIFLAFYVLGSIYLFSNYFMRNWREGTRFLETDVMNVVSYVKNNTRENEKIFVLNWWDNIYPLTGTLPATDPWVPQLSWYQDIPGVQEKEVENLKATRPKLILFKEYEQVGLAAYKPQKVLDFIYSNYKLEIKIDNIGVFVLR